MPSLGYGSDESHRRQKVKAVLAKLAKLGIVRGSTKHDTLFHRWMRR